MIVSILVTADKVELAREKAKSIPEIGNDSRVLNIPLSADGSTPITHYYCFMNIIPELFEKLKSLEEFTEIDAASPRVFLKSNNLQVVKNK